MSQLELNNTGIVNFDNQSSEPLDIYISFNLGRNEYREPAFFDNDKPLSKINGNSKKPFHIINLPSDFKLEIEVNSMPINKGKEAIKIYPGNGLGEAHHTEMHIQRKGDKTVYIFKIHYKSSSIPKPHIDPTVIHPSG